jgi:hypothetical protein
MDSLCEVHEVNAYGGMVGWIGKRRVRPVLLIVPLTKLDESGYNLIFVSIFEIHFAFVGLI